MRFVRLFMKRTPSEGVWREQANWMVGRSLDDVKRALANLKSYTSTPEAGKEMYGQKLRGIHDQFGRYVPPKDVMDEFDLLPGGQTKGQSPKAHDDQPSQVLAQQSASAAPTFQHRWKATRDASVLLAIIDNEISRNIPSSASDVQRLVSLMPVSEVGGVWEGGKLRKKAKD
eukprot:IDg642t1